MFRLLTLSFILTASQAPAQMAALSDYQQNYPGEYSENGQCGAEVSVSLSTDGFRLGETQCSIADIDAYVLEDVDQAMIRLIGSNCDAEGEPTDDMTLDVGFTGQPEGEITVILPGFERLMIACTQ